MKHAKFWVITFLLAASICCDMWAFVLLALSPDSYYIITDKSSQVVAPLQL